MIKSVLVNNMEGTTVESVGTFIILIQESIFLLEPPEQIISDDPNFGFANISFNISNDSLFLAYACFDCPSSTFIRQ